MKTLQIKNKLLDSLTQQTPLPFFIKPHKDVLAVLNSIYSTVTQEERVSFPGVKDFEPDYIAFPAEWAKKIALTVKHFFMVLPKASKYTFPGNLHYGHTRQNYKGKHA